AGATRRAGNRPTAIAKPVLIRMGSLRSAKRSQFDQKLRDVNESRGGLDQAATPEKMTAGDVATVRVDAIVALAFAGATIACSAVPTAGFWYPDATLSFSADARDRLGGALTSDEVE